MRCTKLQRTCSFKLTLLFDSLNFCAPVFDLALSVQALDVGLFASRISSARDSSIPPLHIDSVSFDLHFSVYILSYRVCISVAGELKSMSLPRAFVEEKRSNRGKEILKHICRFSV